MNWSTTTLVRKRGQRVLEFLTPGKESDTGWEWEDYFPKKRFRGHLFSDEALRKAEDALEVRPPGKSAVEAALEAAYDHAIVRTEE